MIIFRNMGKTLFGGFIGFLFISAIYGQQDDTKYSTDTIDVRAEYFKKPEISNTSFTHATYEDLRKTPGAGEDIIKYFQSSPGVAISSDAFNDLIVRGGSPIENLVTVDGMEIRNP